MARPDKSYLEKQTSRRNPPKKKKVGEAAGESRFAKISFKNYLRQVEEDALTEFDDEDGELDEGYYGTEYEFPFIKIVREDDEWYIVWEEEHLQPNYWWTGDKWDKHTADAKVFSSKEDAIADYGNACEAYTQQFP